MDNNNQSRGEKIRRRVLLLRCESIKDRLRILSEELCELELKLSSAENVGRIYRPEFLERESDDLLNLL